MEETYARLLAFAERRVASPSGRLLLTHVETDLPERLYEGPLVPWEMSLGFYTEHWALLSDEERLALNHWLYFLHYFRIADGERYGIVANAAIADFVAPTAPVVAALLRRENDEEWDHIAAFDRVRDGIARRWGYGGVSFPVKPFRRIFIDPRFVATIVRTFGAHYVVVHFTARGIINHMGKAYEKPIADMGADNAVSSLSQLHVDDENLHMAASHFLSATGDALASSPKATLASGALAWALRRTAIWSVFSEALTKQQERAMTRRALAAMPVFRTRHASFLDALVADHFRSVSGVERAKNDAIAAPNMRILSRAALDDDARRAWVRWMRKSQGNLRHFPEDYAP